MFGFLLFVVLASLPAPGFSIELHKFPIPHLQNARLGNIQLLCQIFCDGNEDYDYEDYFYRALDDMVRPRIFCGICKKKMTTTTQQTTVSPTPSPTTSPTKPPESTTATQTSETTSAAPPTTEAPATTQTTTR